MNEFLDRIVKSTEESSNTNVSLSNELYAELKELTLAGKIYWKKYSDLDNCSGLEEIKIIDSYRCSLDNYEFFIEPEFSSVFVVVSGIYYGISSDLSFDDLLNVVKNSMYISGRLELLEKTKESNSVISNSLETLRKLKN